jgi:hypothetical protein
MNIREAAKNLQSAIKNERFEPQPLWGYEDIGAFFLLIVSLSLILRLLTRLHFRSQSMIINPSVTLQSAIVLFLGAGLYFALRFRHRQPVLKPLGWVVPQMAYIVTALIVGPSVAAGIAFYIRLRNQITPPILVGELLA